VSTKSTASNSRNKLTSGGYVSGPSATAYSQRCVTNTLLSQAVDPLVMAPFMVGDFVDYIGFKSTSGEIICYSIAANNIQILTTGAPTYIRMEDALIGIFTTNNNAEVADTRVSNLYP
jgi:hypothetical protein